MKLKLFVGRDGSPSRHRAESAAEITTTPVPPADARAGTFRRNVPTRLFFALALAALLVTGCAKLFTDTPSVTSDASGPHTNHEFTVAPPVQNIINTGQAIAPVVPQPWGVFLSGILGLSTIVLGLIARVKSKQASVLPAIIGGVEQAANNQDVKTAIQKIATSLGVQDDLHAMVQNQTRGSSAGFGVTSVVVLFLLGGLAVSHAGPIAMVVRGPQSPQIFVGEGDPNVDRYATNGGVGSLFLNIADPSLADLSPKVISNYYAAAFSWVGRMEGHDSAVFNGLNSGAGFTVTHPKAVGNVCAGSKDVTFGKWACCNVVISSTNILFDTQKCSSNVVYLSGNVHITDHSQRAFVLLSPGASLNKVRDTTIAICPNAALGPLITGCRLIRSPSVILGNSCARDYVFRSPRASLAHANDNVVVNAGDSILIGNGDSGHSDFNGVCGVSNTLISVTSSFVYGRNNYLTNCQGCVVIGSNLCLTNASGVVMGVTPFGDSNAVAVAAVEFRKQLAR